MGRNIVICSDGTGNTAIKGRGSNVYKLFEAIDLNSDVEQITIYDDGVGTSRFRPFKIMGGAFGWGVKRNVRQLYTELCRVYQPGDKIYLFGFSRGAFTVRSLAALINAIGIIDNNKKCSDAVNLKKIVFQAYREYRYSKCATLEENVVTVLKQFDRYKTIGINDFRNEYCLLDQETNVPADIPIQFIGAWDTVCAVGFPIESVANFFNKYIYRFKLANHILADKVAFARHALSIDDERAAFHPLMWDEPEEKKDEDDPRIRQIWFAGVHANVGGGYPKQGISHEALSWMIVEAKKYGLHFNEKEVERIEQHKNVYDKLYDSRSGLGYLYRYRPRDINKICTTHRIEPCVHSSAIDRLKRGTEEYAPGNLPSGAKIEGKSKWDEALTLIPDSSSAPSLLDSVGKWIRVRKICHFFVLITFFYILIEYVPEYLCTDVQILEIVFKILCNLWIVIILALSFIVDHKAQKRIDQTFANFWHKKRL